MNRMLGSMRRIDEARGAVRVEDVYDTDIDDLWSALTEPRRLARWIAEVEGDDLRPGGEVRARFTSQREGTVRVEACDRPRRLRGRTRADERPHDTALQAPLTADGDPTIL